jgi:hypothetical protein
MRSFFSGKFWIVALSLLGLAALTALALGLGSMSFREGQAIGRNEADGLGVPFAQVLVRAVTSIPFQNQLIFIVLIALLVILISLLMSPEGRKRLLRVLFRVAVTYIIIYLLITRYPEVLEQLGLALTPAAKEPSSLLSVAPPPEFTPPESVSWVSYALSFAIMAVVAFGAWRVYALWRELNAPVSDEVLKRLGKIARKSLGDLSAGGDSTDVILACYYRMNAVVSSSKRLDRDASMTPAEFGARLAAAGLPSDAVERLTRLFESVRYGGYKSSPKMVNEAVACLQAISIHCGEPV